jgi:hypothetical protein
MTHDRQDDQPAGRPRPELEQDGRGRDDAASDAFARAYRDATARYRVPPAAPLEAMWARIEAEHFGPATGDTADGDDADVTVRDIGSRPRVVPGLGGRRHVGWWGGPAMGLAAGLLLGVGIGAGLWRHAPQGAATPLAAVESPTAATTPLAERAAAAAQRQDPLFQTVATDYFDEAVALLATLPARLDNDRPDARLAAQARDLLSTTRLLLDSPAAGADPQLQMLLDDLELVLAQVVRIPAERDSAQAALINEALEQRDVLPRLRSAAAQASTPIPTRSGDD